jgi:6-phosphofructokinase 1
MKGLPVLGVMTTGGDCPGLNAALAALGKMAPAFGYDVLAIRGGTTGLLRSPPDVFPLTPDTLDETIISQGGSILGSINADGPKPATAKESRTLQSRIKKAVYDLGLSGLIIIGGDGSFRIAHELHQNTNIPIIGIPKTIDRDVGGTHYTLGFDSAVAENVRALSLLRATASSHHRLIIAEVMGRSHGHLALASGLAAMVDAILIPECHPDVDWLCAQLEKKHHQKSLIVVLAEGLQTLRGLPGGRLIETLADALQTRLNRPTRSMVIGYLQRGAPPTSFERLMASRMAHAALSLAKAGEKQAVVTVDNHGNMGHMTLDALITAPVFFNQNHLMLAESLGIGLGRAPSPPPPLAP